MDKTVIFNLLGGLSLLIYGIHLMGVGLQRLAGHKLKEIFAKVISNRLKGVLVGAGITAMIQSSSATSVLVVGFVSAGLMNLTQAIAVMFGANIGTTITGQLIAFKLTHYALPIIVIGAVFYMFSKSERKKNLGEAILGFGILFLGLNTMTGATSFLRGQEWVAETFVSFADNPFLGILAGFLLTLIIQSSSATIGILIALASSGMVSFESALPIIMGDNIGTCTTALISSISSTYQARRAALSHLLFNLLGTCVGLIFLPLYILYIPLTSNEITRQIANSHTIFNIINVILFMPAIPLFAKILKMVIPEKEEEKTIKYLEERLIKTPSIAIEFAIKEMMRMTEITQQMIDLIMKDFDNNKESSLFAVAKLEETVDTLQDEITKYLIKITRQKLIKKDSNVIPSLLHAVNDIERIGDHAINLSELLVRKLRDKLTFSAEANKNLEHIHSLISDMMKNIQLALKEDNVESDQYAKNIYPLEKELNELTIHYRDQHIKRLGGDTCNLKSSVIFSDFLMNFEKIGDHLTNIADAKLGTLNLNK